jgi:hypothetical protein
MTSQLSSPAKSSFSLQQLTERQNSLSQPQSDAGKAALQAAKSTLLHMDVVGLTEDMGTFERALAARWPDFFAKPANCRIPSGTNARNPTSRHPLQGNASSVLDMETREAIRKLNLLDASLYIFAAKIARAQSACLLETGQPAAMQTSAPAHQHKGVVTTRPRSSRSSTATRKCFEHEVRMQDAALT